MTPTSISTSAGSPRPAPPTGTDGATDAVVAFVDFGLEAANEAVVGTAQTWNALFRAYVDTCDASRQIFGGLLVDWHQRFLNPPR